MAVVKCHNCNQFYDNEMYATCPYCNMSLQSEFYNTDNDIAKTEAYYENVPVSYTHLTLPTTSRV